MSSILKSSGSLLTVYSLPIILGQRTGVLASNSLHTSATLDRKRNARKGLRVPKMTPRHIQAIKDMNNRKPFWYKPTIMPTSPLTRTLHPKNQFEAEDRKIKEDILAKSADDEPIDIEEFAKLATFTTEAQASAEVREFDPYCREPMKCILCPKRYSVDYIRPSWKNPKLLAQFVSPHTGLTYQKHITGLCEFMQQELELEVKRAQKMGYMATKIKEVHYLKDPPLFDPARPMRKNPH